MSEIAERLAELERLGLIAPPAPDLRPAGAAVLLDGKPVLLLCSNNYLGLADHPRVREAAADAAMRWGVGAGASRLVSGTMTIHRRLEERLADFEGTQACLLFGSGYLANIGVIGALAGPRRRDLLRRAQPRLDRRRLPPLARRGRRVPPPRRRAPRLVHAPPRRAARRRADRHRLGVLDGRRRRAARGDRRARADLRRAARRRRGARDRARRARRSRRGRRRRPRGRGRRDRRDARQGARLLRRLRVRGERDGRAT